MLITASISHVMTETQTKSDRFRSFGLSGGLSSAKPSRQSRIWPLKPSNMRVLLVSPRPLLPRAPIKRCVVGKAAKKVRRLKSNEKNHTL